MLDLQFSQMYNPLEILYQKSFYMNKYFDKKKKKKKKKK